MDPLIILYWAVAIMAYSIAAIPFLLDWREKKRKALKKAKKKEKRARELAMN